MSEIGSLKIFLTFPVIGEIDYASATSRLRHFSTRTFSNFKARALTIDSEDIHLYRNPPVAE
jgi:hypothetical protein